MCWFKFSNSSILIFIKSTCKKVFKFNLKSFLNVKLDIGILIY